MSMPVNGYTPASITYNIYSNTVQGYTIRFTIDLAGGGVDPAYHEEIAGFVEDAATAIKAAVTAEHPTWTVFGDRTHDGYIVDTV